ncbi:MAG TPA: M50 family metallopeptidase [Longimicrobiales bacterium]|nr:M50 family metallopeptidase [Longimicrobiales bacterium]
MRPVTKRRLAFLAGFALYFVLLWLLWWTPVVYPLKIFVVLLHELSHALAAVATGGTVERILLTMDEGGACFCPGGNAFVTLSAGYLGSLAWGLALLEAARLRARPARLVVAGLGVAVGLASLLFVRTAFGLVFGLLTGLVLLGAARVLRPGALARLLTVLGLTSALYAVLDIRSDVLQRPHLESDARMLAELTGVPTLVWGLFWIALALGASAVFFRRAYRSA